MGLSGEEYDRQNPQYTPNKDRRMKEWREKKKKKQEEKGKEIARDMASREAEREERNELSSLPNPDYVYDPTLAPPSPFSRREHFEKGHSPEHENTEKPTEE